MHQPLVSIVLRSFNEAWALRETLSALFAQDYRNWELIAFDSGSTDASVDLIRAARPRHFIQMAPGDYMPGRVLNHGMRLAQSEFVVFINADATPQGPHWLEPLVKALQNPMTAAVFGRQVPRPGCRAVFACDYERCFGENRDSARWPHFFSMASSGLRKDIWAQRGFLETLRYSEDDEYTRWCVAQGYRVAYCEESVAMHSHNYTPDQAAKRSYGEGHSLAFVWPGRAGDFSWPRTVLMGLLSDARHDLAFCARHRCWNEWLYALKIRWRQRRARLTGFHDGWRQFRDTAAQS